MTRQFADEMLVRMYGHRPDGRGSGFLQVEETYCQLCRVARFAVQEFQLPDAPIGTPVLTFGAAKKIFSRLAPNVPAEKMEPVLLAVIDANDRRKPERVVQAVWALFNTIGEFEQWRRRANEGRWRLVSTSLSLRQLRCGDASVVIPHPTVPKVVLPSFTKEEKREIVRRRSELAAKSSWDQVPADAPVWDEVPTSAEVGEVAVVS